MIINFLKVSWNIDDAIETGGCQQKANLNNSKIRSKILKSHTKKTSL